MSESLNIPKGFTAAFSNYSSPFDKEQIEDDDKELWLIRIPDNLNEHDLSKMKIKLPSEKASKKALGKLEKDNKYALYKVPTENSKTENSDDMSEEESYDMGISGHEMVSLDCLVPCREESGKFVFAPKKFDQYLILNQVVDIPDSTTLAHTILDKPVYKREQPKELRMRFKPYGYHSEHVTNEIEAPVATSTMEDTNRKRVSEEEEEPTVKEKRAKKEKKEKKKEKKEKK